MRPTLRQLQYLVAIDDTGKFGDAAKSLHVSQPSLSAQVAEMEAYLGETLIERGRHGAVMTPLGTEIAGRARLILREVEELRSIARQGSGELAGRIQLGVLPSIGPYLLPLAVKELHARFPELRLVVSEERVVNLVKGLADGHFDTIISSPEDHLDVESVPLFRETLWVCAAQDDPMSNSREPISIAELEGQQLLALGHGHRLGHIIENIAEKAKAVVSSEYRGTSLDAVRQMAVMGAGIAVLPSLYALTEAKRDPDFVVRRIDDPMASREVALFWRKTSPLSERYRKLGEILADVADRFLKKDNH